LLSAISAVTATADFRTAIIATGVLVVTDSVWADTVGVDTDREVATTIMEAVDMTIMTTMAMARITMIRSDTVTIITMAVMTIMISMTTCTLPRPG